MSSVLYLWSYVFYTEKYLQTVNNKCRVMLLFLFVVFTSKSMDLMATVLSVLSSIPDLCSPSASLTCLPTIMFLGTTILKYVSLNADDSSTNTDDYKSAFASICKSFKRIITSKHATNTNDDLCTKGWQSLIQR